MKKLVSRNLSKSNLFYSSLKNFPKLKLKQLLGRCHVSLLNQAAVPRQVLHIVHDDSIERTVKTRQLIVALLCTPMSCGSRRASAPWTWKCKKILIRRVVDILKIVPMAGAASSCCAWCACSRCQEAGQGRLVSWSLLSATNSLIIRVAPWQMASELWCPVSIRARFLILRMHGFIIIERSSRAGAQSLAGPWIHPWLYIYQPHSIIWRCWSSEKSVSIWKTFELTNCSSSLSKASRACC